MENKDKMTQNYEQRKQLLLMPVREMKQFVADTFEVRHNVITDVYEFRRKEGDEPWRPLDEHGFNTIACSIEDANIFCLDSRIKHWLRSDFAKDYHPVRQWLESVRGKWDGKDRTEDLFSRISPYRYCRELGRNQRYTVKDEFETLFFTYFRPTRNKKEGETITAEEVLKKLSAQDHYVVRNMSPSSLGTRLVDMGLTPRHTRRGNAYRLVSL